MPRKVEQVEAQPTTDLKALLKQAFAAFVKERDEFTCNGLEEAARAYLAAGAMEAMEAIAKKYGIQLPLAELIGANGTNEQTDNQTS